MNFKNILKRAISGLVYVGIIIGCLFAGPIAVFLLAALFGILATVEFSKITSGKNKITSGGTILDIFAVISVIFAISSIPAYIPGLPWCIMCLIIFTRFIFQLYQREENPVKSLALSMLKYIYIGVPLGCMCILDPCVGGQFVFALFLLIWINDTGAFIVGCSIGRHRLFERLSPKKSWEGFFGGLIFAVILSMLFSLNTHNFFGLPGEPTLWIPLGILVSVFATWGDLTESMIKRSLNIKDSGHLIPGHGGILDRIDSLLFVMPMAYIFIYLYRVGLI